MEEEKRREVNNNNGKETAGEVQLGWREDWVDIAFINFTWYGEE